MTIRFSWPLQNKPGEQAGGGGADDAAANAAKEAADKEAADKAAKEAADKTAAEAAANAGKTPEQLAAEKKAADDAAAAAAATKQPPDKYSLTKPEGDFIDDADITALEQIAKSNKWTNEEAQAELQAEAEVRKQRRDAFLEAAKKHPEIGGDKLAEAQANATAAMDRFLPADDPDGKVLRTELTKNGFGNWPPLVKLLARIGAAMKEDAGPLVGKGAGGGNEKRSHADVLFGDAKK